LTKKGKRILGNLLAPIQALVNLSQMNLQRMRNTQQEFLLRCLAA
jgi:hypothetical protein